MSRASGVARRRKKTANLRRRNRNTLKRVRKSQLKKTGGIPCEEIRQEWNMQRSMRSNMEKMGLSHDPNYSLAKDARESGKLQMLKAIGEYTMEKLQTDVEKIPQKLLKESQKKLKINKNNVFTVSDFENEKIEYEKSSKPKTKVIEALEKKASIPAAKNFRFGPDMIEFCIYMIEKYGDDYEAMSRDKKNHYQDSAGKIKANIKKFLSIPDHQRTYERIMDMFEERYQKEIL